MKNALYTLFTFIIFSAFSTPVSYSSDESKNMTTDKADSPKTNEKDEKCFKNFIIQHKNESRWVSYPVYTGNNPQAPLQEVELVVEPARKGWVLKPANVMCLVEIPPVVQKIEILSDTVHFKDFQLEAFEYTVLSEEESYSEEVEVVCPQQKSPELYYSVSQALINQKLMSVPSFTWSLQLELALKVFQLNNALPVGDLDYKTLAALGVKAP